MSRHNLTAVKVTPVRLNTEQRERVASALEPHLRDSTELDEAICKIEKALTLTRGAQACGLGKKPERVAKSVRTELEEFTKIGQDLLAFGRSLSDDAQWFLMKADRDRDDGLDFLATTGARLKHWGRKALEELDAEGQPAITKGPPYRGDMRLGAEELCDIWEKYTGKGLSRQNCSMDETSRDDGPFPLFLRVCLKVIDPDFQGTKLARDIHERRREQKRVDQ